MSEARWRPVRLAVLSRAERSGWTWETDWRGRGRRILRSPRGTLYAFSARPLLVRRFSTPVVHDSS